MSSLSPGFKGTVDLIHERWQTNDFGQYHLSINPDDLNGKTAKIAYQKLSPALQAQLSPRTQRNLITKAFDFLAKNELENQDLSQLKSLDLESRIQKITEFRQNLTTLQQNLENHNHYIKISQRGKNVPLHTAILNRINKQFENLNQMANDSQNILEKQIIQLGDKFQESRQSHRKIDYQSLIFKIHHLEEQFATLNVPIPTPGFIGRVNIFYLQSFLDSDQASFVFPELKNALHSMGFSDEMIEERMPVVRKQFSQFMHAQHALGPLFHTKSPLTLFNETRNQITISLLSELKVDPQTQLRFLKLQTKLQHFVEANELQFQKAAEIFKKVNAHNAPKDIKRFNPIFNPASLMGLIFTEKEVKEGYKNLMQSSVANFDLFTDRLDEVLQKLSKFDFSDFLLSAYRDNKQANDWLSNNEKYKVFAFDQNQWGSQYVLNKGVCMVLNYRWIKGLLKDPHKIISSLNDIDPNVMTNTSDKKVQNIPITAQDRKNQAEYSLGLSELKIKTPSGIKNLGRIHGGLNIPPKMLKKDGLVETVLFSKEAAMTSILELIDQLKKINRAANEPIGIASIPIFHNVYNNQNHIVKSMEGHVMGLQIDEAAKIYRFWDVNKGFYAYPSLNELEKQLDAYMKQIYSGIYNSFNAVKYEFK